MRVEPKAVERDSLVVEEIKEDEWLQKLPKSDGLIRRVMGPCCCPGCAPRSDAEGSG